MAKTDFFKSWAVTNTGPVGDVFDDSTLVIYDDGGDKVLIYYTDFGSTYPAVQDGVYELFFGEDSIVANFTAHREIKLTFPIVGGTPDYNKLTASVYDPTEHHYQQVPEEVGEWEAEADSGT